MKKGFTLIELLAVIVILAIIALIATPIVLSIIENTKESALLRSAEFYLSGVEQSLLNKSMMQGGIFDPNVCIIQEDGSLICDEKDEVKIEVNGEKPSGGIIEFDKNKIINASLFLNDKNLVINKGGKVIINNYRCTYQDIDNNGEITFGDLVTCGTESFHVIKTDETNVTMLSKYNLEIGYICENRTESYSCDPWINIKDATGMQSEKTIGSSSSPNTYYAITDFGYGEDTAYWVESRENDSYIIDSNYAAEGKSYPYVYGDYKNEEGRHLNYVYEYVKDYEDKLKDIYVEVKEARLISYEEFIDIKNNNSNPNWLYTTSYYTGSAYNPWSVWYVDFTGKMSTCYYINADVGDDALYGVRPVITISKKSIAD